MLFAFPFHFFIRPFKLDEVFIFVRPILLLIPPTATSKKKAPHRTVEKEPEQTQGSGQKTVIVRKCSACLCLLSYNCYFWLGEKQVWWESC